MDAFVAIHVMEWRINARNMSFYVPKSKEYDLIKIGGQNVEQEIESWQPSCRLEDAWRVVRKISDPFNKLKHPPTGFPAATAFVHWFDHSALWAHSSEDVCKKICVAALDSIGIGFCMNENKNQKEER